MESGFLMKKSEKKGDNFLGSKCPNVKFTYSDVSRACAPMRRAEFRLGEPETEMVVREVLERQSAVSLQFPLE